MEKSATRIFGVKKIQLVVFGVHLSQCIGTEIWFGSSNLNRLFRHPGALAIAGLFLRGSAKLLGKVVKRIVLPCINPLALIHMYIDWCEMH